jgi:hypothetical protein
MQNVREALELYAELGFDTLPLRPGTKQAMTRGWQRLPPEEMWKKAPNECNLGIRAGGKSRLAIIDCDEKNKPGTYQNFQNWLTGLGYQPGDYPLIQTASGNGRHIYVSFTGELAGHFGINSESFGEGEFRHGPGAYVVAPPSMVQGNAYQLLSGDYHRLPALDNTDVCQFLKISPVANNQTEPSCRSFLRIPRRTLELLNGKGIERYSSRSEVEQAILTGLVNKGFEFPNVLSLFLQYPCAGRFKGEYAKSPQDATKWLRRSFDSAQKFTSSRESRPRQLAKLAIEWAKSRPWIGKTGQYDKMVYIAHASIAFRAGRLEYGAAARDLANMTALSPEACLNATERLCGCGLLTLVKSWAATLSNTYRLGVPNFDTPSQGL